MVEACLQQCTRVFLTLREAGVLHGFRFEYDVSTAEPTVELSGSVASAVQELVHRLQGYKDRLPTHTEPAAPKIDPKLVQIQVDRKVINDRIEAFITRKRKEVDDWNIQEFCSSRASEVDSDAGTTSPPLLFLGGATDCFSATRVPFPIFRGKLRAG